MIGQTISHYKILAKLGEGGMGVVYQAEDLDLKVTRALKFLPPHAASDDEHLTRLTREARAAAALEHPNICPVHEIGRADGQTFIVMSYLKGRTLEERLNEEGPLPIDEALKIATEIGDALSRAHRAGIVHRDIKPANIMLTEGGQTVVMDFGLAKSADLTKMTRTGTTLGTAAYMSPEQMQGETVDLQADLWALGVVLYEMLTGRVPFGGDNLPAVAYAVQHKEPESPSAIRTEVSADLERVIDRTLAKDPGQRYQTASELAGDLTAVRDEQGLALKTALYDHRQKLKRRKRLLYGVLAAAVAIAAATVWWVRHQDLTRIDSLAVLPFANLSGQADQDFFADGMTDALITQLHELASDQVRVIGRTSVMSFKHTEKTLPQIAAELGVDAVVEASVVRSGSLVRIAAKLIRARPQEQQLWADTFERNQRDILSLHADIAMAVAEQIQLILTPSASHRLKLAENRPVDPEAFEAYLKGRHYLLNIRLDEIRRGNPQALEEFNLIGSFFTKSIEIDSTYSPAWAGLAEYHIQREHEGIGTDAIAQALSAVERALELDENLGAANAAMGHLLWDHMFKAREAEVWIRRATELNPSDSYAQLIRAYYCMTMGRYEESVHATLKALEIDPLSRFINLASWMPLTYAGRYDQALLQVQKFHETFPDEKNWRFHQESVFRHAGRHEDALAALRETIEEIDPINDSRMALAAHLRTPYHLAALGRLQEAKDYLEQHRGQAEEDSMFGGLCSAYASVGEIEEATKWLDEMEKVTPEKHIGVNFAILAVKCNDLDRAFAYLENAYEHRIFFLNRLALFVENSDYLHPLVEDPRYHEMVHRIGVRD